MPKLYYSTTSCSAATFIAAHLDGLKIEVEQVDIYKTHKTNSGVDFYSINPKGNVPAMVLDDGTLLNENISTLLFVADQKKQLVPAPGTSERYTVLNLLSYIASEVHPSIADFFSPVSSDVLSLWKTRYHKKLSYLENVVIGDKKFIANNQFSVADIYLYISLSWIQMVAGAIGGDLREYPKTKIFYERIAEMEGVKKAHALIATNPAFTI